MKSANIMSRLEQPNTTESLMDFWQMMGHAYLIQSHEYLKMNIAQGCVQVPFVHMKQNFNQTVRLVLDAWHLERVESEPILNRVQKLDYSRKSQIELQKDPHHSSSKFSPEVIQHVKHWIKTHPIVHALIVDQRSELKIY